MGRPSVGEKTVLFIRTSSIFNMKFNFFFSFNLIHEMVKTARRAALLGISTNSSRRWVMSLHAYWLVFFAQ